MTDASRCSVTDCERKPRSQGLCYAHYMKQWRYGTPTPQHPVRWIDYTGQRFGTLTVIERLGNAWRCQCDCGEIRIARVGDLHRTQNRATCGIKQNHRANTIDYSAMHSRLRTDRGPASTHRCVDCGRQAHHWSYDHTDPAELISTAPGTQGIAYSTDPAHYQPRCVPCHKRFDLHQIGSTADATAAFT